MRIIKRTVEMGNGAAVYIPKEYSGREIVIILPEGIDEIKRRVLTNLIEFMPNIIGVYIYGSYARGEEEKDSDIDILVITKEKDDRIKNVLGDIDLRVLTLGGVKKTIDNYPALIMPILREARPLLNSVLLEELKKSKIDFKKLKWNFEDIKRILRIIKEFIELDEKEIAPSHIYSLIMRAKVCYLIECMLKNKNFSNDNLRKIFLENGFEKQEVDRLFLIYRKVRENEEIKISVKKEEILKLLKFIKSYSEKLEHESKKKIGKRY